MKRSAEVLNDNEHDNGNDDDDDNYVHRFIPLEEGWHDVIKAKVRRKSSSVSQYRTVYLLLCVVFSDTIISLPICLIVARTIQAIDKLEAMLNGGLESGQTNVNVFGPREYVDIYT